MKQKHSIFSTILLLILLLSIGAVLYLGWQELKNELSIYNMEKELKDYVSEPSDNDPKKKKHSDGYGFDWDGLLNTNKDIVGWIRFDEPSVINYPIVQGTNNQFYLKHDWKKRYQNAGSIFLHKENSSEFTDQNSIIYGHRMISGRMFGSLKRFSSQSYMNKNKYFYIYTPDGKKRTYEIFAYAQVVDGTDIYTAKFETKEERNTYYEKILKRAVTKRNIELDEFDTTATLSTCARYGYYNRMVLVGKLISIEVK